MEVVITVGSLIIFSVFMISLGLLLDMICRHLDIGAPILEE